MLIGYGDIFHPETIQLSDGNFLLKTPDVVCITTNGGVKKDGKAIMGKGCAKQACDMFKGIDSLLGQHIKCNGNIFRILCRTNSDYYLASFPTKPISVICNKDKTNIISHMRGYYKCGDDVPGWASISDINIIIESCNSLVSYLNLNNLTCAILPRPGCTNGGLDWEFVRSKINSILDNRVIVTTFKRE